MSRKLSKKLYYLRAFQYNDPLNLEQCLRQLLAIADNVHKTEVVQAGEITQITHRNLSPDNENQNKGLLLHIEKGNQNEHIKTIRHKSRELTDEGSKVEPPQNQSFMDKECFVFIDGQHIIFCGNNMTHQALAGYLHAFSQHCQGLDGSSPICKPSFKSVPNYDKLQIIKDEGVKSISAELTSYYITTKSKPSVLSRFKNLFRNDEELAKIHDTADLQVNIEIKLDGNTKADLIAQKELCEQAELVINECDNDFKIITQKGNTISPDDVKLAKLIYIPKHDNTNGLSRIAVLPELVKYFKELQQNKVTEL